MLVSLKNNSESKEKGLSKVEEDGIYSVLKGFEWYKEGFEGLRFEMIDGEVSIISFEYDYEEYKCMGVEKFICSYVDELIKGGRLFRVVKIDSEV